jgi:hypothetical protein
VRNHSTLQALGRALLPGYQIAGTVTADDARLYGDNSDTDPLIMIGIVILGDGYYTNKAARQNRFIG